MSSEKEEDLIFRSLKWEILWDEECYFVSRRVFLKPIYCELLKILWAP